MRSLTALHAWRASLAEKPTRAIHAGARLTALATGAAATEPACARLVTMGEHARRRRAPTDARATGAATAA